MAKSTVFCREDRHLIASCLCHYTINTICKMAIPLRTTNIRMIQPTLEDKRGVMQTIAVQLVVGWCGGVVEHHDAGISLTPFWQRFPRPLAATHWFYLYFINLSMSPRCTVNKKKASPPRVDSTKKSHRMARLRKQKKRSNGMNRFNGN